MDPLAASSTVNVKYKPEIVVMGLDIVYIVLGDDFVLNCSYKANPTVTAQVLWYKNGKLLDYKKVKMRNLTMDGSVIEIVRGESQSLTAGVSPLTSCIFQRGERAAGCTVAGSSTISGAARWWTWPRSMLKTSPRLCSVSTPSAQSVNPRRRT